MINSSYIREKLDGVQKLQTEKVHALVQIVLLRELRNIHTRMEDVSPVSQEFSELCAQQELIHTLALNIEKEIKERAL